MATDDGWAIKTGASGGLITGANSVLRCSRNVNRAKQGKRRNSAGDGRQKTARAPWRSAYLEAVMAAEVAGENVLAAVLSLINTLQVQTACGEVIGL